MRTLIRAALAIVVAVAVALWLARLFDKAAETVRDPQPMRPAVAPLAPCPPGHAMIARICVVRS